MESFVELVTEAARLLFTGDIDTWGAVGTSLRISIAATAGAAVVGVPIGLIAGMERYRAKRFVFLAFNTLLSMPTVVVGLVVYLFLTSSGPLGGLQILFSPSAMVIGEFVLILPVVIAFSATAVTTLPPEVEETARSLGASWWQKALTVLDEARFGILAALVAAFGRAVSEVGAAIMLGGNIRGYTRTMTSAIALETSRGEFGLGLALGLILMLMAFSINCLFHYFQQQGQPT